MAQALVTVELTNIGAAYLPSAAPRRLGWVWLPAMTFPVWPIYGRRECRDTLSYEQLARTGGGGSPRALARGAGSAAEALLAFLNGAQDDFRLMA